MYPAVCYAIVRIIQKPFIASRTVLRGTGLLTVEVTEWRGQLMHLEVSDAAGVADLSSL